MAKADQELEDLSLLVLYLSSWEEKIKTPAEDVKVRRAWKGILFEVIDKLQEDGLISGSTGAKSIYLTDDGIKRAKKLEDKFLKG